MLVAFLTGGNMHRPADQGQCMSRLSKRRIEGAGVFEANNSLLEKWNHKSSAVPEPTHPLFLGGLLGRLGHLACEIVSTIQK